MLIWTSVVLGETELPEFVLEKIEALARSAESPIISSNVAARPWELLCMAGHFYRSPRATEVPNRSSESGKQIQARSNTHSHITLAKREM
jgi:hypothetical protein